jgi:spermidine/putrescine transport system substrate-binding protein
MVARGEERPPRPRKKERLVQGENQMTKLKTLLLAGSAGAALTIAAQAQAETLRLLTWNAYAPDEVIAKFEAENPGVTVEVTYSSNEDMIAKLRATGGAGFDLAQPSHDRIYGAQTEYEIYKPLDLSKINVDEMDPGLLKAVEDNTTIDGNVYAVPFQWGTSGLVVDTTKAPDVDGWDDLCDPAYAGKTSMRLRRTILLGTAFAMGKDPFALYSNPDEYQKMLDEVEQKLIACKSNVKAYWEGGTDLEAMVMSGEVVASEAWDQTAFKLMTQNPNFRYVPPATGALTWIDTFVLPAKGEADDAAYKWINFTMRPDIVPLMSASTGSISAVKGGLELLPDNLKSVVTASFDEEDIANLKYFANIPPGLEDMEGKVLDRIQSAASN